MVFFKTVNFYFKVKDFGTKNRYPNCILAGKTPEHVRNHSAFTGKLWIVWGFENFKIEMSNSGRAFDIEYRIASGLAFGIH